jgi:predicted acylesterase/phospholipase RssA
MYDTMILSGGGTKGLCSLGVLQYLQDSKRIDCSSVKRLVGTSIGAIICYFLAIGYSPIELVVYLCSHGVLESLTINNFDQIVSGEGIYDYQILRNVYEKMTLEKMDTIPTLNEVYTRFGKELVICTYNFTDRKTERLSYHTHPDLSCMDALRMSSNLPFIFSSFVYGDKEYIDGGVIENFSFSMLSSLTSLTSLTSLSIDVDIKDVKDIKDIKDIKDEKVEEKEEKTQKKIVGIYLDNQIVNSSNDKEYNRLSPVLDKIYTMLMIPTSEYEKQMIQTINHSHVDFITVSVQNVKIYTFKLPHTDKLELFSQGYNRAKEYYSTQTDK